MDLVAVEPPTARVPPTLLRQPPHLGNLVLDRRPRSHLFQVLADQLVDALAHRSGHLPRLRKKPFIQGESQVHAAHIIRAHSSRVNAQDSAIAAPRRRLYNTPLSWGSSSAGRAPRSQRGGRGFESLLLHQFFSYPIRRRGAIAPSASPCRHSSLL